MLPSRFEINPEQPIRKIKSLKQNLVNYLSWNRNSYWSVVWEKLLAYVSSQRITLIPRIPTPIPHIPTLISQILILITRISTPFPAFPTWFHAFPPWFLAPASLPWFPHSHLDSPRSHPNSSVLPSFPSFRSPIPHSGFYRYYKIYT